MAPHISGNVIKREESIISSAYRHTPLKFFFKSNENILHRNLLFVQIYSFIRAKRKRSRTDFVVLGLRGVIFRVTIS